jgi:hypothetical protein
MNHPNDPKRINGDAKTPLHLLPPYALAQIAWAHKEGAEKYGAWNWRQTGVCATTYIGAIMRHLAAWQDGEDNDPDSGLSHIAKIGACCNILLDAEHCGRLVDDRSKVGVKTVANEPDLGEWLGPVVLANLEEELAREPWMPKPPENLREDIQRAINCRSAENGSDTPDWILAEYLMDCLAAFDKGVKARESWYGREPKEVDLSEIPCPQPEIPDGLPPLPPVPEGQYRRKIQKVTFAEVLNEAASKINFNPMGPTLHAFNHFPNAIPDGLPPLPPVPEGYDRWEYRGTGWSACNGFTTFASQEGQDPWVVRLNSFLLMSNENRHYIEAVR